MPQGSKGREYIKQQKGYMLPHCRKVYWCYISWLFNFLVEVREIGKLYLS